MLVDNSEKCWDAAAARRIYIHERGEERLGWWYSAVMQREFLDARWGAFLFAEFFIPDKPEPAIHLRVYATFDLS